MNDDFYVGYQPQAPAGLARFLRLAIAALALVSAVTCVLLVVGQARFDNASFDYLNYQPHRGTLRLDPYPRLDGIWLVGPGKHGLEGARADALGAVTNLQGALIRNAANTMLEVLPGSMRKISAETSAAEPDSDLGEASLTGEIVDTKCYFGVMNPGRGKVHRACAARCLSGGIPAGLLMRDAGGTFRVVILANTTGGSISRELAPMAGERVRISGRIVRSHGSLILKVDPGKITRE